MEHQPETSSPPIAETPIESQPLKERPGWIGERVGNAVFWTKKGYWKTLQSQKQAAR